MQSGSCCPLNRILITGRGDVGGGEEGDAWVVESGAENVDGLAGEEGIVVGSIPNECQKLFQFFCEKLPFSGQMFLHLLLNSNDFFV